VRRHLPFLSVLLTALLLTASCSKEEAAKPPLDSIIGEWVTITITFQGAGNWEYTHTLTFKEDGTFTYHRLGKFEEQRVNYNSSGTYTFEGDVLTLNYLEPAESTASYTCEFTSDSVILTSTTTPGDVKEYDLQ
jgi:hypothetical protein